MAELDDRKTALIAQLDDARSRLGANRLELADDLNFPAKLQASVKRHRAIWLGAAALLGFVITQLPRRTKKVVVERKGTAKKEFERAGLAGISFAVLKILFNLAKPAIITWVSTRFAQAADSRADRDSDPRRR